MINLCIAFVIGVVVGFLAVCLILGSSKSNREHEAYMEGYIAGKAEKKEERKGGKSK